MHACLNLVWSLERNSPVPSPKEGIELISIDGLDPTVLMWLGEVRGTICSNSLPQNKGLLLWKLPLQPTLPCNQQSGPNPSFSLRFRLYKLLYQTDSVQFRPGLKSHLHKQLVAYVTRAQYTNYEKPAHPFRCLRWTMAGRFHSSGLWLQRNFVPITGRLLRGQVFPVVSLQVIELCRTVHFTPHTLPLADSCAS